MATKKRAQKTTDNAGIRAGLRAGYKAIGQAQYVMSPAQRLALRKMQIAAEIANRRRLGIPDNVAPGKAQRAKNKRRKKKPVILV